MVSHTDITARKLDEVALLHDATHDPLTGLLNRALLLAELRRELHRAQGDGSEVSVLYLDLDGFKAVNDSLGHRSGDDLLRTTAQRLRAALRPGDHLARMGGDEFVAVLPRTAAAAARRHARRLAAAARRPVELDGMPVTVTASIGIAGGHGATATPEDVLAAADYAMYRAKQQGRARTEVFAGDLRARAEQRTEVEGQLAAALDLGELQLFRQPVVRLGRRGAGRRGGAPALVHPRRAAALPRQLPRPHRARARGPGRHPRGARLRGGRGGGRRRGTSRSTSACPTCGTRASPRRSSVPAGGRACARAR